MAPVASLFLAALPLMGGASKDKPVRFLARGPAHHVAVPVGLPMAFPGFGALLGGPHHLPGNPLLAGIADGPLDPADLLGEALQGSAVASPAGMMLSGGHTMEESHSVKKELGEDGKMHTFEVVTKCADGHCETSKRDMHGSEGGMPVAVLEGGHGEPGALSLRDHVGMGAMPLPFVPGLGELLSDLLDEAREPIDVPNAVQSLRLRPGPGLAGRVAAPLEHFPRDDGSEVIQGELPKGLDTKGLAVEQRGDVVLLRYVLNRTSNGKAKIGVEQQFRLGFQPERKEKARYNPRTGRFHMEFARPANADFDPHVEILFEKDGADGEAAGKAEESSSSGSQQDAHAPATHDKPEVIFEVGDEL